MKMLAEIAAWIQLSIEDAIKAVRGPSIDDINKQLDIELKEKIKSTKCDLCDNEATHLQYTRIGILQLCDDHEIGGMVE